MGNFVALDLETANSNYASICEIGLVRFEDGRPTERWTQLIAPPEDLNYFENTWIHGITEDDVKDAPTFRQVQADLSEFIAGEPVVAHYSGFDMSAIRKASDWNGLAYPDMTYYCTVVLSRKALKGELLSFKLQTVADYFDLGFEQVHRADSDAATAGEIAVRLMNLRKADDLQLLADDLGVRAGRLGAGLDLRCTAISIPKKYENISPGEKAKLVALQREIWGADELDPSGDFFDKKVVMTGTLRSMNRDRATALLESVGARITSSVTKKTDFVVQGFQQPAEIAAGGSNKEKQARALLEAGVEIEVIQEEDFLRMLLN